MRAVVYAGKGRVEVADVAEPGIEEPGDALVRVGRAAICGSDLHLLDGKTPGMRKGGVIGHEFVGTVEEIGDAVPGLEPGERVLGSFLIACGACDHCRKRRFNYCSARRALGQGRLTGDLGGAQAELVRVPLAAVNLKPLRAELAGLSDESALFCGDILTTGFYAAALAEIGPGEVAAVIGAGPVGLFCAAACRRAGAEQTIVLDLDGERTRWASENMGFPSLQIEEGGDPSAAFEALAGRPADAAIEAVGAIPALKTAMRCVRDGGRVAVVGVYGAERYELPMGMAWIRGLDIRFSGMANIQRHWDDALGAVLSSKVDPVAIITHRLALEDAVEGYELFRSRRALKVVLEI